jgi:hypothetical protein
VLTTNLSIGKHSSRLLLALACWDSWQIFSFVPRIFMCLKMELCFRWEEGGSPFWVQPSRKLIPAWTQDQNGVRSNIIYVCENEVLSSTRLRDGRQGKHYLCCYYSFPVCLCIPWLLLGNGSVNTFLRQYTRNNRCVGRVSKDSRFLPEILVFVFCSEYMLNFTYKVSFIKYFTNSWSYQKLAPSVHQMTRYIVLREGPGEVYS